MNNFIGYDGYNYPTKKDKLKADLKYVSNLIKQGKKPFYGKNGELYLSEEELLQAEEHNYQR